MKPLWKPSLQQITDANMTKFMRFVAQNTGYHFTDYYAFYRWSVQSADTFWDLLWQFSDIQSSYRGERIMIKDPVFSNCRFFPDARLNYAENLLALRTNDIAIMAYSEDQHVVDLTFDQLYHQVSTVAAYLKQQGIQTGDRVAGLLPNIPQAIVAALATISLGAVWSSCSPDFGVQGIVDRFSQIEPKFLFACYGYYYKSKIHDCLDKISALIKQLPSLQQTILIDYGQTTASTHKRIYFKHDHYQQIITDEKLYEPLSFVQVAFDHPLFIMFSSGTTGVPKCIVHGHGGTLLQHIKEHRLHCDIKPGDKLFYYTTTSWMMWNWLMSGLASHATLVLYDGSPFYPRLSTLFDMAAHHDITHFGVSAKYLDALQKAHVDLTTSHQFKKLRMIMSTGSPLAPEGFDYVYNHLTTDVCLASISGGTDILSCFALGNPIIPVWRGELQTPGLALAVDVFDDNGQTITGHKRELVCTQPFPSMPVMFWNDPQGQKFQQAYFSRYPNIWYHGDYVQQTEHHGMIIYGRSDTTLKPGGIRIGTAEIYRQVEKIPEVMESVAVGQLWQHDERIILFVKLGLGINLDHSLQDKIRQAIRSHTTIHHVPALIFAVPDIPRTINGKIIEIAVKDIIHGRSIKNIESIANPECLRFYQNISELQYDR